MRVRVRARRQQQPHRSSTRGAKGVRTERRTSASPATATLSLMALAGLAARRRRK